MRAPARQTIAASQRELPSFAIEAREIKRGNGPVAGIDEAGRGPWAGPVVAAAVILNPRAIPAGLDDSKAIDAATRQSLYQAIVASGACIGVGIADVERIDRINILRATLWAMAVAVRRLAVTPGLALVDGNRLPPLTIPTRTINGGDGSCQSIAAASIVAKVTRDTILCRLAGLYPGYGFERHKGYGTPEHKSALDTLGACPEHRRSFKPVRIVLQNTVQSTTIQSTALEAASVLKLMATELNLAAKPRDPSADPVRTISMPATDTDF